MGGTADQDTLIDDGENAFSHGMNIARFEDTSNELLDASFATLVERSNGRIVVDNRHGVASAFGRTAGDVSAFVSGDHLVIVGSSADDSIVLTSTESGDVVVSGRLGTTINGGESFTAFSGVAGVLPGNLTINGLDGIDLISVGDVVITGQLNVVTGSDEDAVLVSGVSVGGNLVLRGTGGMQASVEHAESTVHTLLFGDSEDDLYSLTAVQIGGVLNASAGNGDNQTFATAVTVADGVAVSPGSGSDFVRLVDSVIGSTLYVQTGAGDDRLETSGVEVGSTLYVNLGEDDDVADMDGVTAGTAATIRTGTGNDAVRLQRSLFEDSARVFGAAGNKVVDLDSIHVTGATAVQAAGGNLALRVRNNTFENGSGQFVGGVGSDDVLLDDNSSSYASPPNFALFEDVSNDLIDEAFEDLLDLAF